jgi:hypothetical protein
VSLWTIGCVGVLVVGQTASARESKKGLGRRAEADKGTTLVPPPIQVKGPPLPEGTPAYEAEHARQPTKSGEGDR